MKDIIISGEIGWDVWPANIRRQLIEANGEDVKFIISSPGGFVSDALEIFNMIRNYAGNTIAVLSGFAMSAASYIPLAADEIHAEDNAVFMIHNVHGGVWGDHNDILHYGEMVQGLSLMIAKAYAKHTGKPVEDIQQLMDAETYFFGDEIVSNGFASKVIGTDTEGDSQTAKAQAKLKYQTLTAKLAADKDALRNDLDKASAMALKNNKPINRAVMPQNREESIMDVKELRSKYPDLVASIEKDATAGHAEAITAAKAEGAKEERERIQAVHSQSFPGFENIVTEAMFDGKSKAGDVAIKINAANLKKNQQAAQDSHEDAPDVILEPQNNDSPDKDKGPVTEEKLKAKWDKDKALQDEFAGDFELCKSYYLNNEGVRVKVLKNK
jgi:ATP-dependent Clp protease, protease subunit